MDADPLEKVRRIASRCNQHDLLQLRANCRAKQNLDATEVCERELDLRFPNWQTPATVRTPGGGKVPTKAMFREHVQECLSQIDAYVWLVNQFSASHLNMFKAHGRDDVSYEKLLLGERKHQRMHFAPTPELLEGRIVKDHSNDSRPVKLDCGWWANTNLSGLQKLRILERLAQQCSIVDDEWTWVTAEEAPALHKKVIERAHGRALLDKLARQK